MGCWRGWSLPAELTGGACAPYDRPVSKWVLIQKDCSRDNACPPESRLSMVWFAASRIAEAIREDRIDDLRHLLVTKKANPNACEEYGRTPMELAVRKGSAAALQLLIAAGADTQMNYEDGTLLHVAAARGHMAVADLLAKTYPYMISAEDDRRNTPLHTAAHAGYAEMVTFLIDNGANPALKNKENRTPLYLAQKQSHPDVIEILQAYHDANPLPKPAMPRQIEAARAAEPRQIEAAAHEDDGWRKLADDRIAHVTVETPIGYKITEVFNFAARERTRIYHNLETRLDSAQTQGFDEIAEKAPIEDALTRLRALGGTAEEGVIHARPLGKPSRPRGPDSAG